MSFHSCVAEATIAALGLSKLIDLNPCGLGMTCDDHLAYTLSIIDNKGLVGKVDQDHAYFSTVVAVNGAGGIDKGDAMFERETAAWA